MILQMKRIFWVGRVSASGDESMVPFSLSTTIARHRVRREGEESVVFCLSHFVHYTYDVAI